MMLRVNVGCGARPTPGWTNFDNSLTVRFARSPLGAFAFVLPERSHSFARCARASDILWADATRLPLPDGSAEVIYTSHMLDQMVRSAVQRFLKEARRVLAPRGVLRVAVQDLRKLAATYLESGDADEFMRRSQLSGHLPETFRDRLRLLFLGSRIQNTWMFDGDSLTRFVSSAGFVEVATVPAGETRIHDPAALDLFERSEESVYVEATRP